MNQPKVSVIIPVYNVEKYLRECLDSVAGQTLKEIEIICVDDGSTDGSLAILRDYEQRDPRFRVLCQQNKYAGVARNAGMEIARGKYYVFLDADDFFEPELLEVQYGQCERYGADVGLCAADFYDDGKKTYQPAPWLLKMDHIKSQPFNRKSIAGGSIFDITTNAPWNKIFSADFVRREGLLFQALQRSNDCYFVVSALALAGKVVAENKALVHYRVGQTGNLQSALHVSPLTANEAAVAVKRELEAKGIYREIDVSFRNWALTLCNWTYKKVSPDKTAAELWVKAMKEEYLDALDLRTDDSRCLDPEEHAFLLNVLGVEKEKPVCKVSVVVAAYNVEQYVEACLNSLAAQTLINEIEILCVNDGSTDNTPAIIRRYAEKVPQIRLIDKEKNEGLYMARKSGAQAARGKYVMFLDADDAFAADACERAFDLIERKGVDFLQFGCGIINHTDVQSMGRWLKETLNPKPGIFDGDSLLECFFVTRRCGTSLVGKIFAADLCRQVYRHIDDFHCFVGEDLFQSFYYACFARSFAVVKTKPLYLYEYGRGVSNWQTMELQKFEIFCRMADLCRRVRAFLTEQNAVARDYAALDAMAARMTEDCCRIFKERIRDEDREAAAEMLLTRWWDFPDCRQMLREAVGRSLYRKHCRARLEVFPGAAWKDGKEPKVSVIIPVYNVEEYLRECLDSVVHQSLREIEIICVDDGSTDSSPEILREYQEKDDRITIIRQKNQGQSAARNVAMDYVRGRYAEFLDSDDYLADGALEELYRISEEKELDTLFFDFAPFTEGGTENFYDEKLLKRKEYAEVYYGPAFMKMQKEDQTYATSPCFMMIRSDFYRRAGLDFYEGIIHEDELFCFRLLMAAERVSHVGKAFYRRRIRQNSTMTTALSHKNVKGYFITAQEMLRYGLALENDSLRTEEALRAYQTMRWAVRRKYRQLSEKERRELQFEDPITQELFEDIVGVDYKLQKIYSSLPYKIAWLPRKAIGGFRSLRENGLAYTFNLLLIKLKLKNDDR